MDTGKFFALESALNSMVLDLSDSTAAPGQPVCTWPFHGGDNQLWYEDPICHVIRSKLDDHYVLEVQGNQLVVNQYDISNDMQHWHVDGNRVHHVDNYNSVFDVAATESGPGGRVCAWDFHGGQNQVWRINYQGPAYCVIRSQMHGKVMDVRGGDTDSGAEAIMYDFNSSYTDNQMWWEDALGHIHSKLNDFVLDTADGTVRLRELDISNKFQYWVKSGERIMNKDDPTYALDIKGGYEDNGTNLIPYEYNGQANQHWVFEYL